MTEEFNKLGPPAADRGVYGISVTAELSGLTPQSLRLYERYGLLTPMRSPGGTRRYSADDLHRLQRISELTAAGVNLAGIARILSLEDQNSALHQDNTELRASTARRNSKTPSSTSPPNHENDRSKRSPSQLKS